MHILLIDDSSSTRSLLRTLINSGQQVRHDISEASSGEEALQKVSSGEINLPDLIIADINMGGMTGYEVCREFRARHTTGSDLIPYVIIVTANEGIDVINQALDSGANDYMPKPVNVKVLQTRLRVAERLLMQAQSSTANGTGNSGGTAPVVEVQVPTMISWAVDQTDAPIAVVEVSAADPSFRILYTNAALSSTTGSTPEQLIGQSLSELEAWTPEFLNMTLGFVNRGAPLSHVPLWSKTRQEYQVYLSFYPIRSGEESVSHYLVIHHL